MPSDTSCTTGTEMNIIKCFSAKKFEEKVQNLLATLYEPQPVTNELDNGVGAEILKF